MGNKDLGELVAAKLAAVATAKRKALDDENVAKRRTAERKEILSQRMNELQPVVFAKCKEARIEPQRQAEGFSMRFGDSTLVLGLEDVGDAEVDVRGWLSVKQAKWDFYFTPDNRFVSMRFVPNPGIRTHDHRDRHPSTREEFVLWAVTYSRMMAAISPTRSNLTPEQVIHEAIAKLIELANLR